MKIEDLIERANRIRSLYAAYEQASTGREWDGKDIAMGFAGDVGDIMKLVAAKEDVRDYEDVDDKLAQKLANTLWSVIILAEKYDIDLEAAFTHTMDVLEERFETERTERQEAPA